MIRLFEEGTANRKEIEQYKRQKEKLQDLCKLLQAQSKDPQVFFVACLWLSISAADR